MVADRPLHGEKRSMLTNGCIITTVSRIATAKPEIAREAQQLKYLDRATFFNTMSVQTV